MKHVVVVEDDRDIRDLIRYILSDNEYTVSICANATDFKTEIQNKIPDVVLLDVMLPDGNGVDLCRELKTKPDYSTIPVIIMSANKDAYAGNDCSDLFIPKPFDIDYLKSKVETYLLF